MTVKCRPLFRVLLLDYVNVKLFRIIKIDLMLKFAPEYAPNWRAGVGTKSLKEKLLNYVTLLQKCITYTFLISWQPTVSCLVFPGGSWWLTADLVFITAINHKYQFWPDRSSADISIFCHKDFFSEIWCAMNPLFELQLKTRYFWKYYLITKYNELVTTGHFVRIYDSSPE